jgi:hypothetical protein
VALGAEGQQRARRQQAWAQRLARGVERQQRAIAGGETGQARQARRRQGELQPRCATQRVRRPWVVASRRQNTGRIRCRRHAHARAQVAEIARILEQHEGLAARSGEHCHRVDRRALCQRDHAGARRQRGELREHLRADLLRHLAQASCDIRREQIGQPLELGAVAAEHLQHVRAEAQRVLERMKAFEHRQARIAPRAPEARNERSLLHSAIIAVPR